MKFYLNHHALLLLTCAPGVSAQHYSTRTMHAASAIANAMPAPNSSLSAEELERMKNRDRRLKSKKAVVLTQLHESKMTPKKTSKKCKKTGNQSTEARLVFLSNLLLAYGPFNSGYKRAAFDWLVYCDTWEPAGRRALAQASSGGRLLTLSTQVTDVWAQRLILRELFEATDGNNWTIGTGWWDSNTEHCDWYGITCNLKDLVIGIDLDDNKLVGDIPTALCSISTLTSYFLSGDSVTGGCSTPETSGPSLVPSSVPSLVPSYGPSAVPVSSPSAVPSSGPSGVPSSGPSFVPSSGPSSVPSVIPSLVPSLFPSFGPSAVPSSVPSAVPSSAPSGVPSSGPSSVPSSAPSFCDWSRVGNWTQVGNDIDGEAVGDRSGLSVSLSSDGRTVAIGAPNNNTGNYSDSGHVRVYKLHNLSQ